MQAIYSIAYNLSKQEFLDDKELIEELLSNFLGELIIKESIEELARGDLTKGETAERPVEELIEESARPLSIKEVIEYIKHIYPNNKMAQRIIASKVDRNRKIPPDLVKQGIKIKIGDYKVRDRILYIRKRLYIPNVNNVRVKVL